MTSLFDRVSVRPDASPMTPAAKSEFFAQITSALAHKIGRSLTLIFPAWDELGFTASFREEPKPKIKIRNRQHAVVVQFHGFPDATAQWVGIGANLTQALQNLTIKRVEPSVAASAAAASTKFDRPDESPSVFDEMTLPPGYASWKDYALSKKAAGSKPPKPKGPGPKDAQGAFLDLVRAAVKHLAGREPTLIFPSMSDGFESSFKEGGKLKIRRTKDGSGYVARMHGFPTYTAYFKGYGVTPKDALVAMKPEFEKKSEPKQEPKAKAEPAQGGLFTGTPSGSWKWSSDPTKLPEKKEKKEYTPEQKKLYDLVKPFRKEPLKRQAAGGIVVKDFNVASIEDMEILVAKTHPKWGSYWVIPKGGADVGENIHDTASREVREETGVEAKVVDDEPWSRRSVFGDSGKYDLPLILKTLKDAYPAEAEFIDSMADDIKKMSFTWENTSSYYVMQHVSGEPMSEPDDNEEMSFATFMPIKEALKLSRVGDVVKNLLPRLQHVWQKQKGSAA